jgi:hypothetical protein
MNDNDMEARSCACPGEAEEAVAALASQVLLMTPTVKFFQFGIWEPYTLGDARKQRRYHR